MKSELLAVDWERFVKDGDASTLLARIHSTSPRQPPPGVSFPCLHRICDVELGGQAYRVTRLVDLDAGQGRLFIETTDSPDFLQPGVPYWLQGAALAKWVEEESESPSDDEIDWEQYRAE